MHAYGIISHYMNEITTDGHPHMSIVSLYICMPQKFNEWLIRFWSSGGGGGSSQKFATSCLGLMNQRAKFDAATFILGREIHNRILLVNV